MSTFEEDLAAQAEIPFATVDVPVNLNGSRYVIRVTQMGSLDWAALTALHPIRPRVPFDLDYGYNIHSLSAAYVTSAGRPERHYAELLRDDVVVPTTQEQWETIVRAIDGGGFVRITDAVFSLNNHDVREAGEHLKKALMGGFGISSTSPSSSESLRDDSRDGSPSAS